MGEFFGVIGELVKTGRVQVGQDYQGLQAENYDLVQSWVGDVNYYVDWAKKVDGPVLELACGTGRVGMEIAKTGSLYTGVDLSSDMLKVFERKLDAESQFKPNVKLVQGDVCRLNLGEKYALAVMPCYSFTHLVEHKQRQEMLEGVFRHLLPGGILTLEAPLWVDDEEWTGNKPQYSYWRRRGDDVALSFFQTRLEGPQLVGLNFLTVLMAHDKTASVEAVAAREYRVTAQELKALAREAGFTQVEVYRDYKLNPLGKADHAGVLVAIKP